MSANKGDTRTQPKASEPEPTAGNPTKLIDLDGSEKSLSPDGSSKTPDSGPNEEFDGLSDIGSRKESTDDSPRNEEELVEFVVDDFMEKIKEGLTHSFYVIFPPLFHAHPFSLILCTFLL